jgi:hypothetical protein
MHKLPLRNLYDGPREQLPLHWIGIIAATVVWAAYSDIFGQGGKNPRPISIAPPNPILRHNSVHAGRQSLVDHRPARRVTEANSDDRKIYHISNHGSTSRPAQSAIGGEYPYHAMSGHPGPPEPRRTF